VFVTFWRGQIDTANCFAGHGRTGLKKKNCLRSTGSYGLDVVGSGQFRLKKSWAILYSLSLSTVCELCSRIYYNYRHLVYRTITCACLVLLQLCLACICIDAT